MNEASIIGAFRVHILLAIILCVLTGCGNKERDLEIQQFYRFAEDIAKIEATPEDTVSISELSYKVSDSLALSRYLNELLSQHQLLSEFDSVFTTLENKYKNGRHLDSARILHSQGVRKKKSVEFLARTVIAHDIADFFESAENRCQLNIDIWDMCIGSDVDFSIAVGALVAGYSLLSEYIEKHETRISHWLVTFAPDNSAIEPALRAHEYLEEFYVGAQALSGLAADPHGSLWTYRGEVREVVNKANAAHSHFKLENSKALR